MVAVTKAEARATKRGQPGAHTGIAGIEFSNLHRGKGRGRRIQEKRERTAEWDEVRGIKRPTAWTPAGRGRER